MSELEVELIKAQQEKVDAQTNFAVLDSQSKDFKKMEELYAEGQAEVESQKLANENLKVQLDQLDVKYRELQIKYQDSTVQSQLMSATSQHEQIAKEGMNNKM